MDCHHGLHGKGSRVGVGAHQNPRGIGPDVVDAVRHSLAQHLVGEVVHPHLDGASLGLPLTTGVLVAGVVPDQLLLLGVHR